VPFLDPLAPDIAVIQECAQPLAQTDQCLWFGDNPRQGIAVRAGGPYRLRALSTVADVPPYVIPLEVTGPVSFTLLVVWSKRHPKFPYVEGVVRAVELYRHLLSGHASVVMGDFNSNAIWDAKHPPRANHSALVALLAELGLESAYHAFLREAHGQESRPTHYFHWDEQQPFHIDYCFIPRRWLELVQRVEVPNYADWSGRSDHRPLIVDVDGAATHARS
jgi:hypothetical protein